MRATILIHAQEPQDAPGIVDAATVHGPAVLTAGPYDAIVEIDGNPDSLARTVLEIQKIPGVSRTLTLAHVIPEPVH